jgi:hypothetical protein
LVNSDQDWIPAPGLLHAGTGFAGMTVQTTLKNKAVWFGGYK